MQSKTKVLRQEIESYKEVHRALQYRIKLEELVAHISRKFIDIKPDELDETINETLRFLGVFSQIDRSYLFLFTDNLSVMNNTHEWCAPTILSQKDKLQNLSTALFPWWMKRLRNFENIHIPCVAELPEEAKIERMLLKEQNIQSVIVVPLFHQKSLKGFLGFDSVTTTKRWASEDIQLLQIVGEILVNALERKRYEELLLRSEEKYKTIFNQAPLLIMVLDDAGLIVDINPYHPKRLHALLGPNLKGKSIFDNHIVQQSKQLEVKFRLLLKGQAFQEYGILLHSPDMQYNGYFNFKASPITTNAAFTGAICLGEDITERITAEKLAEEREQQLIQADKMSSLGILVAGVAHEINNPNSLVLLNAEILCKIWENIYPILQEHASKHKDFTISGLAFEQAHGRITKMFHGIVSGGERIKNIIQSLKDFYRKDSGTLSEIISLNKVAMDAIAIVENLIIETTSNFHIELDDTIPSIKGNSQRLEQVIINLITNACHALEDDNSLLLVRTSWDKDKNINIIEVIDKGMGISEENLGRIMYPFFTTKSDTNGCGLGLAVSYNIIKEHHGTLQCISKEGDGSTFRVELPVHQEIDLTEIMR